MMFQKVFGEAMMVLAFLDEASMFTETCPEGPNISTYVEQPTWARKAIYYVVGGTIEKILEGICLSFN